jgi:hypothetical protein
MARRKGDVEWQVRISFETARTAAQCLSAAYERLVPTPSRPFRTGARSESSNLVAEAPLRRRAERG